MLYEVYEYHIEMYITYKFTLQPNFVTLLCAQYEKYCTGDSETIFKLLAFIDDFIIHGNKYYISSSVQAKQNISVMGIVNSAKLIQI